VAPERTAGAASLNESRSEGLEPPAYKFVACCSIQLSYDRVRASCNRDDGARRERDSNPRYDFTSYNGLANRRLQPLGHLSRIGNPLYHADADVPYAGVRAPQGNLDIVDDRKIRERDFHDAAFGGETERRSNRFYALAESSSADYRKTLFSLATGRRILEYGCGPDSYAFALAPSADVVAIDISPVAIERARVDAQVRGLQIDLRVMDAETLEFRSASFDVVCGKAILHHLDLERAYSEIARVLKPDGVAIFWEPLGHNALINLYRARTPNERTPDEHPLLIGDLELARRFFQSVSLRFYHLATLAAIPFLSTPLAAPLAKTLDSIDRMLFAVAPPMRRYAWVCVLVLSNPTPSPQTANRQ
jgi:SAM-dependent methyltransferase